MTTADTLPQDALRAAVIKALLKVVSAESDAGKAALKDVMDALEIDSLAARLPDGTKVATLNRAGGNTSAKVTDEGKFKAWVQANRPGEVITVVRDSYQKALLEALDKSHALLDPETGEVVPGVEFVTGKDWLTVLFKPGGEEAIKQAWRSGRLSLDAMLALPGSEGENNA
jgi:hypothetical protein